MKNDQYSRELIEQVSTAYGLDHLDPSMTEDMFVQILADRVAELLDHDAELLFSSLYRMDVSERKVAFILQNPTEEATNIRIARLILERQKQRLETKKAYKPPVIDGWDY